MKRLHLILGFLSIIPFLGMSQISKMDEIKTKNHAILCLAYSPEGSLYATSGYEQTIVVRNPRGEMVKRLTGHKDLIKTMTFSHDGKFLIGGGEKKTLYIWNMESGSLMYSLKGHKKDIKYLGVNKEGMIASASSDGMVRMWILSTGTEFKTIEGHEKEISGLCFNGEGTQFATSSLDYNIKVWDGKTGALLKTLRDTDKKAGELTSVAFSPDGKIIAAGNSNKKVALWNAHSGLKLKELPFNEGILYSMQFSPDSRYLATGSSEKMFIIYDLSTSSRVFEEDDNEGAIYSLCFSPEGEKLIMAEYTNSLYIWDVKALGIPEMLAAMRKANEPEDIKPGKTSVSVYVPKSDVDKNIPEKCKNKITTRYAIIIGNEDYSSHQLDLSSEANVDFAVNDAITFSNYARTVFCVPNENIFLLKNAKAVEMHRAIEKVSLLTELAGGKAEIIFYFAGHGFPDEVTKEPYLMPVDVSGNDLRFAINLKELYEKLTQYPHQRVTVFLDACFSGGARNQGLLAARGVKINPKNEGFKGNLLVFSASSGQESSLPYKTQEHGMFTYCLLKYIQTTKGEFTYGELGDYIKTEVATKSILINNKPQNPEVNISPSVINEWRDWTF